jgi:hypothetical protein
MKKIGIALLIIGFAISIFSGFNFVTKEKIADIGSLELTANKNHGFAWSPVIGMVIMVFGAATCLISSKRITG